MLTFIVALLIVIVIMISVWSIAMAFMGVQHVAVHGFDSIPKLRRQKTATPKPEPTRIERMNALRQAFEEELQLIEQAGLQQHEKTAAVMHARQKYMHQMKEILG